MMKTWGPPPKSFREAMFESMAQRIAREQAEIEEYDSYARKTDFRRYIRVLLRKMPLAMCFWPCSRWIGCALLTVYCSLCVFCGYGIMVWKRSSSRPGHQLDAAT